jgi:putative ABC transport system permease protein
MLKSLFKIGCRSLLKRKVYTLINVLGLATGMAVCLLIVLYIRCELNYDNFHKKGDNIYRVVLDRKYPGRSTSYAIIPLSIGEAIQHENPEVIQSTRVFNFTGTGSLFVKIGDKVFEKRRVLGADSNFFQVFTAKMIEGDPLTALQKAYNVVINETTAKKYFGSAKNAMGKSFQSELKHYIISGICKDWPENSHFDFDMLMANSTFFDASQHDYIGFSSYTYLLLNPHVSPNLLESKFPHIIEKYVSGDIGRNFGVSFQQFQAAGNGYHYCLQPLKKIHLFSNLEEGELKTNGSINSIFGQV